MKFQIYRGKQSKNADKLNKAFGSYRAPLVMMLEEFAENTWKKMLCGRYRYSFESSKCTLDRFSQEI